MYASVRKYRVEAERVPELMRRVDEIFAPRLEGSPGFLAYQAIDCGRGVVTTVSTFADEDGAEQSAQLAFEFVSVELADLEIERLEASSGEVTVGRAASPMLEPEHA